MQFKIKTAVAILAVVGLVPVIGSDVAPEPAPSTGAMTAPFAALDLPTLMPEFGVPLGGCTPHPCDLTAKLAKKAGKREAYADYFIAIANCLNDPSTSLSECIEDAGDDLEEELELVEDQYDARRDLCELLGHGPYDPQIVPSAFSENVTNQYFPLVPGRIMIYEKTTPEGFEQVTFTVLPGTVEIEGVDCRIVNDVETLNGEVQEDTVDWYAQRSDGSVWYMGEIAKNFEDGFLDNLDGSWRHGREDAKAGVIMLATPTVGDVYRQEWALTVAEDYGTVISLGNTVITPAGTFTNCVEIEDRTTLEPDGYERKFYAPGVGMVKELDPESGETLLLVQIIN